MGVGDSLRELFWKLFSQPSAYAEVYDGPNSTDLIYEGEIRLHLNGWVELEDGRKLSPSTVHRIEDHTLP